MTKQELIDKAVSCAQRGEGALERGRAEDSQAWTRLGSLYLALAQATPPEARPPIRMQVVA